MYSIPQRFSLPRHLIRQAQQHTAQTNAETFATAGDVTTLASAKTYTDGKFPGVAAHTITLAKITLAGTDGSITWNANGVVTGFVDPNLMQHLDKYSIIILAIATTLNSLCIIRHSRAIASLYRISTHLSKSVRLLSGLKD
jgi:hypothetical protein